MEHFKQIQVTAEIVAYMTRPQVLSARYGVARVEFWGLRLPSPRAQFCGPNGTLPVVTWRWQ